jgi:beta-mannosidase
MDMTADKRDVPHLIRCGVIALLILALGHILPATSKGAPGDLEGEIGSAPLRPVKMELSEFTLCELDLKSLSQIGQCIPARVPGDVFTALMGAGRIPDPYLDLNSQEVQWVDERAWRYETEFTYTCRPGRRCHILFMGLDYVSRVELNGKVLAKHEGMFSRIDFDITDSLVSSGKQKLAVTFFGIPRTSTERLGKIIGYSEFGRKRYLKTQMSFDWDFAPRLKGAGIWDRVYIYETGPVSIRDLFIQPGLDGRIKVGVELSDSPDAEGMIEVTISGETFSTGAEPVRGSVRIKRGTGAQSLTLFVPSPRLWWPWDMGEQNLYRATARVKIAGVESDRASEVFGIRKINWGPNPDAPPGSADWVLFVNDKREFIRGANWVPPEAMHGRLNDSRYDQLVEMARDTGVNCLRIWGGGNRERRAFYDYCDRAGVMVWQEFPFACVFLTGYPNTARFKNLTRQEVEEITRQLRNHASIIMWCGGNEFNVELSRHVVDIMEDVTAELDPTRRFIPASPYKGDSHNWVVWHMKGNLSDYFADLSPFPSEFGLQAFPDITTIENWISEDYRWPIGEVHFHHDLGWAKMQKYIKPLEPDDDLVSVVEASQLMQAHYLQRGIENWRQRKYKTSGTAFWQFNEPWPAICWSVVDYELKPKRAYEVLENTYNPVLVTARFEDRAWSQGHTFEAEIMVVNDLHREFRKAIVEAVLCGEFLGQWSLDVPEDDVIIAGRIRAEVPDGCNRPYLDLSLKESGSEISSNHYELWVHDPAPAGKTVRGFAKIYQWIQSGGKQSQEKEPEM